MIGETISHFLIHGKIGEGGMGIVYKAEDIRLKREVALKFLPADLTLSGEARTRFLHEARIASHLDHPNICTVYEVDETLDGRMFIAMAYYEGETLKAKMAREKLSLETILDISLQILNGLEAAHKSGIIHRDIKPANIFITRDNEVKILDFGLARLENQDRITKTGISVGTAAYMSPEQIKGEIGDHRIDIWAMGVLIHEMAVEKLPFQGEALHALMYSIANDPFNEKEKFPGQLKEIICQCLEKAPEDRYQEFAEIRDDLLKSREGLLPEKKRPAFFFLKKIFKRPLKKNLPVLGAVLIIPLLVIFFINRFNLFGERELPDRIRLAVFPFEVEGESELLKDLGFGLPYELQKKLTLLEKFKPDFWLLHMDLIYLGRIKDMNEAGRLWGVNLVLKGKLAKDKDERIVLTLEFIDPLTTDVFTSLSYTKKISSLALWQETLLKDILKSLKVELNQEISRTLILGNTALPGAYREYLRGLGNLFVRNEKEKIKKAGEHFKEALEQDPNFYMAQMGAAFADYFSGRLLRDSSFFHSALEKARLAVLIEAKLPDAYVLMGDLYMNLNDVEKATGEYKKALDLNHDYFDVYMRLAEIYRRAGKNSEAENMYDMMIRSRPDFKLGYAQLAYFYSTLNRIPEAIEMYLKIIELVPEDFKAYKDLAVMYSFNMDLENAVLVLEKLVKRNTEAYVLYNLGYLYYLGGKYSDALEKYETSLTLNDTNLEEYRIRLSMAECYRFLEGREKEARELLEEVVSDLQRKISGGSKNEKHHSSLALSLTYLGDNKKALKSLDSALRINPNNRDVRKDAVIIHFLNNNPETALEMVHDYLKRAGTKLYLDKDPNLIHLRENEEYIKILKEEN